MERTVQGTVSWLPQLAALMGVLTAKASGMILCSMAAGEAYESRNHTLGHYRAGVAIVRNFLGMISLGTIRPNGYHKVEPKSPQYADRIRDEWSQNVFKAYDFGDAYPSKMAILYGTDGSEQIGFSSKGNPAYQRHPLVTKLYEAVPIQDQPLLGSNCAEGDVVSLRLKADELRTGKTITTIDEAKAIVGESKIQVCTFKGSAPNNPCPACDPI